MNKDEIKKAFDICCDAQTQSCTGCPILELEKRNGRGCKYNMFISVFDLITEQENEIERLKDEIIYLERKIAIRDNALKDRDKAIEMLEGKQDTIVKQAKIDVLNELKDRTRTSYVLDDFILGNVVFSKDIDELIKEVQNAENKG